MIYESSIINLISLWKLRQNNQNYSREYLDGVFDCAHELQKLLDESFEEEYSQRDFEEMEADDYLSSMEFFEKDAYTNINIEKIEESEKLDIQKQQEIEEELDYDPW